MSNLGDLLPSGGLHGRLNAGVPLEFCTARWRETTVEDRDGVDLKVLERDTVLSPFPCEMLPPRRDVV